MVELTAAIGVGDSVVSLVLAMLAGGAVACVVAVVLVSLK